MIGSNFIVNAQNLYKARKIYINTIQKICLKILFRFRKIVKNVNARVFFNSKSV